MKKYPKSGQWVKTFHKGFVYTCIGVTLYGLSVMGLRYYRYVTEVKPQLKQKQLLEEQLLLAEGAADTLKDVAYNINV